MVTLIKNQPSANIMPELCHTGIKRNMWYLDKLIIESCSSLNFEIIYFTKTS